MKVIYSVLKKEEHENIENKFISNNFPWFYSAHQSSTDNNSYLFHHFYSNNQITSNFYYLILPIIEIIKPVSLINIRANLVINRNKVIKSAYHYDKFNNNALDHQTLIYYVNTNNGYTEFENKNKVNCIANSMIIFKANNKHRGCSQTDSDYKSVININFK